MNADRDSAYVEPTVPDPLDDVDPDQAPPAALAAIKAALVTSRLSLAHADTGTNPYDNRGDRGPATVWRGRSRY